MIYIETKDCDGDLMYFEVNEEFYKSNEEGFNKLINKGEHKITDKPDSDLFELFDGEELQFDF